MFKKYGQIKKSIQKRIITLMYSVEILQLEVESRS